MQSLTSQRNKMSASNNLCYPGEVRRVLIFGHTGFIGSTLARHFRDHLTDIEVIGWSLPTVDLTKARDVATLADLFDLSTAVIMCAAIKKQLGDSLEIFSQNLKMVVNLCQLLKDRPVQQFIYFSCTAVLGEDIHNTNITEETSVCPTSYYGVGKHTGERLLYKAVEFQTESSLLALRRPLVYGPEDQSRSYGPSGFVWAAVNGRKITLWGDGTERGEFIFVEDLAKIVHRLTFHKYDGVLNVVSGRSYTLKEALDIISRLVRFGLQIGSPTRTKRKVDHGFNNRLLTELLPSFSFTDLEDGIKRTFDAEHQAMRENIEEKVR